MKKKKQKEKMAETDIETLQQIKKKGKRVSKKLSGITKMKY